MVKAFVFFAVFMPIWVLGCAFIDTIMPDIANAYQMSFGYFTGSAASFIGLSVADKYEVK